MTNFVIHGLPIVTFNTVEYRVADFRIVENLKVFRHSISQVGIGRIKEEYYLIWISATANAIESNVLGYGKFLTNMHGYKTEEEAMTATTNPLRKDDMIYEVIGNIENDGYKRIIDRKVGMYEKF